MPWLMLAAAVALVADLLSTAWARVALSRGGPRELLGGLVVLRILRNTGAAFGIGAAHEPLIEVAVALALVILLVVARHQPPLVAGGLGAALGGGLGNLVVRLTGADGPLHSPVIDWIHLSFYPPTFNLADVAIRAGVLVALLGLVVEAARARTPRRGPESGDSRPSDV